MKKFIASFSSVLLTLSIVGCSQEDSLTAINTSMPTTNEESNYIKTFNQQFDNKGESSKIINIRLKKPVTNAEIQDIAKKYNSKVVRYVKPINLLTLQTLGSQTEVKPQMTISSSSIKSIEPALKVELEPVFTDNTEKKDNISLSALNDPMLKDQYGVSLLQLEEAWKINPGSPKIKIAVLDTGIDLNHPDLKDKIVQGKNVAEPGKEPIDDSGHGTHCAGIAAAASNNNEGGVGIGGLASIMPVKILKYGSGTDDAIAEGIVWAADNGANVMTMSIGIYRSSKPIEDALKYALDKGITITASAGNKNQEYDIHLPSTYPGVIEVASTDEKDQKSSFSNFGKKVSVAAPGTAILSTLPTYTLKGKPLNYGKLSGTSMAAPHVAGLAALILSQKPNLKGNEVTKIIESSSKDLGEPGWDRIYGHGRIDALAALKSLNRAK